jgi:hypothetical protein
LSNCSPAEVAACMRSERIRIGIFGTRVGIVPE